MASWQEYFLENLVAAAHVADDRRLATAALRPRKKTASFEHAQARSIECSFAASRNRGSQAQVLLIECQPKRGTEVDGPALVRELHDAGCGGDVSVDHDAIRLQCQWGHGPEAVFPIEDARRVKELAGWATRSLSLVFDHLERRRHVVTAGPAQAVSAKPLDLRITLEECWIIEHRADQEAVAVRGVIVAQEATKRLRSAVLPNKNISLFTYQFSVTLAPISAAPIRLLSG